MQYVQCRLPKSMAATTVACSRCARSGRAWSRVVVCGRVWSWWAHPCCDAPTEGTHFCKKSLSVALGGAAKNFQGVNGGLHDSGWWGWWASVT